MTKFKVPKQFELAGFQYKVLFKPDLQKTGAHGATYYDSGEVWLDANLVPEDLKGITFYHELFHAIFHTVGRDDLRNDEALVDLMGNLMWQFEKSKVY